MLNNFDRIKKVNDLLKNTGKQSLTDILESFSCITKDYNEIGNKIETNKYSNVLYSKCTEDEKLDFYENQLQLIECLVTHTIYDKTGVIWNWKEIYDLLYDKDYARIHVPYSKN